MLPSLPEPTPRVRADRILIARVITAVGLALLLVVGAWSTSHGAADVHASLCLAPGVSHPVGSTPAGADAEDATAIDVLSSDAAACLVAVLCGIGLVLLLRRVLGAGRVAFGGLAPRPSVPVRAGPRVIPPALTLTQLSISRT